MLSRWAWSWGKTCRLQKKQHGNIWICLHPEFFLSPSDLVVCNLQWKSQVQTIQTYKKNYVTRPNMINMIRTRYMSFLMKLYHNKYIWTPFLSNLEHVRLKYESKRFYKFIFQWNHFSRKLGKKKQKFRLWRQKFLSGLSTTGLDIEEVSYKSWRSESLPDLFGSLF